MVSTLMVQCSWPWRVKVTVSVSIHNIKTTQAMTFKKAYLVTCHLYIRPSLSGWTTAMLYCMASTISLFRKCRKCWTLRPGCMSRALHDPVTSLRYSKICTGFPVAHRIEFKLLMLTFKALHGHAPGYITELISIYRPTRNLRSEQLILCVPKSKAKTTFLRWSGVLQCSTCPMECLAWGDQTSQNSRML